MARVRIGAAPPDRNALNVEIALLRDLDVSGFGLVGTRSFGGGRPLTYPVISCIAFWRIGCRPIIWVTWMVRVSGCLIARSLPRRPGSAPWT
jgi:hypothetical protein